jgi:Holliday junction resolvase
LGRKGSRAQARASYVAVNRYASGARFERKVADYLRAEFGFFVVRSPKSGSPVDLLAVRKGQVLFVQCKTDGRLDPIEWNEFYDLCIEIGAVPLMASNARGKIVFHQLLDRKDGTQRAQPFQRVALQL